MMAVSSYSRFPDEVMFDMLDKKMQYHVDRMVAERMRYHQMQMNPMTCPELQMPLTINKEAKEKVTKLRNLIAYYYSRK